MEKKIKHLEFIQAVITRMNSNSFLLKGWAITLISAFFALAAKDSNYEYIIIAYIAIPLFWGLDAFYLSQERKYRDLYNNVRLLKEENIDFNMDTSFSNKHKNSWFRCIFSKTILTFYLTIFLITLVIMYIVN